MIRITVAYPAQDNARFDHSYYQQQHARLIHEQLDAHGLLKLEVDQCLADGAGQAPQFVACAHLFFADMAQFQAAFAAGGKALNQDMANYTDITPVVTISQVVADSPAGRA
ncbi:EthD family reductase [Halopseudomonas aestusnigri]|jgi:uncharacterized protein (TIGR02118 family)|nr:EthD family reductase [Halopseudomonas aestusnigri]MDL2198899.1 EthD family reductase [Halopseudomonas aestusnigri]